MVRPAGLAFASMIVTVSVGFIEPSIAGAVNPVADVEAIPEHVAQVYEYVSATAPCSISFATLAGVGAVTSDHTRLGGAPRLLPDGTSEPSIVYEPSAPTAPIGRLPDTDGGAIDGSPEVDVTVGPMQFLPQTWAEFGVDGNGDGTADPHNLWDAAAGAANRLCAASVDTDLAGALTAYFGTADYHGWVLDSIAEATDWQLSVGPSPEGRDPEVISLAPGSSADDPTTGALEIAPGGPDVEPPADPAAEISVAGVEQLPTTPAGPNLIGPPKPSPSPDVPSAASVAPGEPSVTGDWNGNGAPGTATLVADGGRASILRTDDVGRPYGRIIDVSSHLADPAALAGLVVGEWDGDGIDDLALLVADPTGLRATRFDRAGNVIDVLDLGAMTSDDTIVVGPAPIAAALTLGGEELWKTVTAADGTVLELWKVGGVIVDVSMVDQTSAMLTAAATDGITLQGWGWRSHDAQIELRRAHCADVWTTPASECSPPTAVPGTSRHEYGTAIDFHVDTVALSASSLEFAWLASNAERFGFYNLASEPWHWSIDGG